MLHAVRFALISAALSWVGASSAAAQSAVPAGVVQPSGRLAIPQQPGAGDPLDPPAAWRATFGGRPGSSSPIHVVESFDLGDGEELYAAGSFLDVGGVAAARIARFDGERWHPLGKGFGGGPPFGGARVNALTVFDAGGGPELYAGGLFDTAGGVVAEGIARWNGERWAAVGDGVLGEVNTLLVHDDGSGEKLWVGGDFSPQQPGVFGNDVALWDGSTWSAGPSPGFGHVNAFVPFDGKMYIGGSFSQAGNNLVGWSASGGFAPLSNGFFDGVSHEVHDLAVFDDGTGPSLYAAGDFTVAGGFIAWRVAKWREEANWTPLGQGFSDTVYDLFVREENGAEVLYAAGAFEDDGASFDLDKLARWDGAAWTDLGEGFGEVGSQTPYLRSVCFLDSGGGERIFVGGDFEFQADIRIQNVAELDGGEWKALTRGFDVDVTSAAIFDDGSGPELYVSGGFASADGVRLDGFARRTPTSWESVSGGLGPSTFGSQGVAYSMTTFDDGGGEKLALGGNFAEAGGVAVNHVALWDGVAWSALGTGCDERAYAVSSFDDGSGEALYVGGLFSNVGGVPGTAGVARWDGSAWSPLAGGLAGAGAVRVDALFVFDDGSGPALFVGGDFDVAGGVPAKNIARWDGSTWSALGAGVTDAGGFGTVLELRAGDVGGGEVLFVGGAFQLAGGQPASAIAAWDGTSWSALGDGIGGGLISALAVFDDGAGPKLYAGGFFSSAGSAAAEGTAVWDGATWSPLGRRGTNGVGLLFVDDRASTPSLLIGGGFRTSPSGDSFLGRWSRE